MVKSTCCIQDCEKKSVTFFLCSTHYYRLYRTGTTALPKRKPSKCKVPSCTKDMRGNGYCRPHGDKVKLYGSPFKSGKMRGTCTFPDCDKPHLAKGYCTTHYHRDHKTGDASGSSHKYIWGEFEACIVCGRDIPDGFRLRRYCSNSCATAKSSGSERPDNRPCAQCGDIIDFRIRLKSGRLKSKLTTLCGKCVATPHMWRYVEPLRERDGDGCHICLETIDFSIKFPDSRSRSVDHVIPRSIGGANEMSNYRLACLGCNSAKGNRLDYVAS